MAKQSMFDFVPLAGSGRIMARFANHSCLISEALKFPQPQSGTRAVAATTIRCDQQASCGWVTLLSKSSPPTANRCHRELGSVVTDADRDSRIVPGQIVHAIRHSFAQLLVRKIIRLYFYLPTLLA